MEEVPRFAYDKILIFFLSTRLSSELYIGLGVGVTRGGLDHDWNGTILSEGNGEFCLAVALRPGLLVY